MGRGGGVGGEGRGYKGILTWIWVQDLTEQLRADMPSRPAHNCSGWTQTWSDRAFIALRKLWTVLDTFSLLESILILISYYVIFLHSKAHIPLEIRFAVEYRLKHSKAIDEIYCMNKEISTIQIIK